MIKGTIFDIDGTLLDTMHMWYAAGGNYLAGLGLKSNKEIDDKLFCMTLPEGSQLVWETFRLGERGITVDDVRAGIKGPVIDFYATKAQPKPGALELLRQLHEANIPVTVATSSDRLDVERALGRLGMLRYVDRVFSCTEIGRPKSDPLIFRMAAEFMGSNPEDTWVFEDGLYAIRTANAHGFRTVGLYDAVSDADWEDIQKETLLSARDCAHVSLDALRTADQHL